jgi:phosphoribosylformimino-5-aminoimidazole carboxamide ribonucleotide (ProFAR) isomerase
MANPIKKLFKNIKACILSPLSIFLNKKVVRLREGDYGQVTEYDVTLEEMIERYQSNGTNFHPHH